MGSLSQFIIEESVAQQLDDAYNKAIQEEAWDDYFEDCRICFVKAKDEKAKISFQGAMKVVLFYYDKILSSSDNQDVVFNCTNALEQMLLLCHERYSGDCPDWYQQLVASPLLNHCFLPGLKHQDKEVVHFAMQQILFLIQSSACNELIQHPGVIPGIIDVVSDLSSKATSVAKTALVTLCQSDKGLHAVFASRDSLDAMTKVAAVSDSAKFNIFEVVQRGCVLGSSQLSVVSNSGWLDLLVAEASTGDTLSHMVALQLLADLLQDARSLRHLSSAGVLHKLNDSIQTAHSEAGSIAAIHMPDLLKVFGSVGLSEPELLFEEYSGVVSIMLSCCSDHDANLAVIAFETLTQLAATHTGKRKLHYQYKSELELCLRGVGEKIAHGMMVQRVRYLAALVRLLDTKDVVTSDRIEEDEVSELVRDWYSMAFPCATLAPIDKMIRLPFPEIHLEAYELLVVLVQYNWGARMLAAHHGILQYLLDRSTGNQKKGKEAKFAVVVALVQQKDVLLEVAGNGLTEQLCNYRRQGAFYVPPYTETGPAQMITQ